MMQGSEGATSPSTRASSASEKTFEARPFASRSASVPLAHFGASPATQIDRR